MQVNYTSKDIERFWGKVDKERSNIFYNGTRCWEWEAGLTSTGYGQFLIQRKKYKPHRISYMLAFGDIQDGLFVLHHCDNPVCLRPKNGEDGNQLSKEFGVSKQTIWDIVNYKSRRQPSH